MEASTPSGKRFGGKSFKDMSSTREGAMLLAIATALLAGLLLLLFVQRYRHDQNSSSAVKSVFVARALIPRGSSADVVASDRLLERTDLHGSQVKGTAITDPSVIQGQVAVHDIYPGSQITTADFAASTDQVIPRLRGTDRAISVPVDSSHGLVGELHDGDHVDVLAGFGGSGQGAASVASLRTLLQNVVVLSAPAGSGGVGGGNNGANVVLRLSDRDAVRVAYAADNGKVWLVLRPPVGAQNSPPTTVVAQNLAAGGGR